MTTTLTHPADTSPCRGSPATTSSAASLTARITRGALAALLTTAGACAPANGGDDASAVADAGADGGEGEGEGEGEPAPAACAAATTLTLPAVGATVTATIAPTDLTATSELDDYGDCTGDHAPAGGEKVFALTVPATASYTFTTDDGYSGAAFDSVLAVTVGPCAAVNAYLACSDDVDAAQDQYFSSFTVELAEDTAYFLVVDSYTSYEPTTLTVTATAL